MGLMNQMGDMYKLQKEAKRIKKELANTHIYSEADGVKVTVSGEQEIIEIEFLNDDVIGDKVRLAKAIKEASNKAFKKAQQVAAEKMKGVMGGMPGM